MLNKQPEKSPPISEAIALTAAEFKFISELLEHLAGIHLSSAKSTLVVGRLSKRLRHFGYRNFKTYFEFIADPANKAELNIAIDLLTTNETSFFREPKHFELLKTLAAAHPKGKMFRVWSAASSSGQEAYTIALVLAQALGDTAPWEIVASDLSERILAKARDALYPLEQAHQIPQELLKKYALKERGDQAKFFTFEPVLKNRITIKQINLTQKLPDIGFFDVIFLRNILIYFQMDVKKLVVENVATLLHPEGLLLIGHSESLHGVTDNLESVKPTVYKSLMGTVPPKKA
ncbi:MAG: CheR family methyltransferase [Pseudomonadota bacterium]